MICEVILMEFHYEIGDEKLYAMVEKKAKELHTDVDELIWCYINCGLIDEGFNDDIFNKMHSNEYLSQVDEALGFK